jgi:hypothetical protein
MSLCEAMLLCSCSPSVSFQLHSDLLPWVRSLLLLCLRPDLQLVPAWMLARELGLPAWSWMPALVFTPSGVIMLVVAVFAADSFARCS